MNLEMGQIKITCRNVSSQLGCVVHLLCHLFDDPHLSGYLRHGDKDVLYRKTQDNSKSGKIIM